MRKQNSDPTSREYVIMGVIIIVALAIQFIKG